jgi:hypothetical protein
MPFDRVSIMLDYGIEAAIFEIYGLHSVEDLGFLKLIVQNPFQANAIVV